MTVTIKKIITSFLLLLTFFYFFSNPIFAQTSNNSNNDAGSVEGAATLGVAYLVNVKNKNMKDGSILSAGADGATPTTLAYDPQVMGVVSRDAAIQINSNGGTNTVPVISQGMVYVLVSTKAGPIKKGDTLASSTIPGVAIKATDGGYVLGTAMEDYSDSNIKHIGLIVVDVNLHYINSKPTFPGSLSDIFKIALLPTKDSPTPIFKYFFAGLVVLGSFVLAFMTFGRTAAKGIEALGRNPAASKIIHLGIILNVMTIGFIIIAGLTVAFLILRL